MKKIILYSTDPAINLSLILYLKDKYFVTTTTDKNDLEKIINSSDYDAVLLDIEPSEQAERLCKNLKLFNRNVPIILIYVYREKKKEFEMSIRKYIDFVFYKPFDIKDMSRELSYIMNIMNKEEVHDEV